MSRASVSTWALHSLIGTVAKGRPGDSEATLMPSAAGSLDLLDVPEVLAEHGFKTMELCHFHVPSTTPEYLAELRNELDTHGIELWSLLIDDGNINSPDTGDRDREWAADWIGHAGALGARCVRIVAGKQPASNESISFAADQLLRLADVADDFGIKVLTENWFDTLQTPEDVHRLFSFTHQRIGLCFDFGNWGGDDKYEKLEQIARYATSCHAKCNYSEGVPDVDDFKRCVKITKDAGFDGPYTLVYGEQGKVWETLSDCVTLLEI